MITNKQEIVCVWGGEKKWKKKCKSCSKSTADKRSKPQPLAQLICSHFVCMDTVWMSKKVQRLLNVVNGHLYSPAETQCSYKEKATCRIVLPFKPLCGFGYWSVHSNTPVYAHVLCSGKNVLQRHIILSPITGSERMKVLQFPMIH